MSSDHTPLGSWRFNHTPRTGAWVNTLRSEVQSPEGKQAVNALAAKSQTLESELASVTARVRQLETRLDPSGSITEKTPSLGGDSITAPPASTNVPDSVETSQLATVDSEPDRIARRNAALARRARSHSSAEVPHLDLVTPVETCDTPSSSDDDTPRHADMLDKFMEVAFTLYCEADPTQEGEFGWPALMPLLDRLQSITWSRQGGSKLDLLHQLEETFDADHSGTVGFVEFVEMLGQPPLIDLLAHELRSLMPGLLHQALASLGEEAEPHGSVVEENEAVEWEPEPEEMITAGDVDDFLAVATNLLFVQLDVDDSGQLEAPEIEQVEGVMVSVHVLAARQLHPLRILARQVVALELPLQVLRMIAEAQGKSITESPKELTARACATLDKYDLDGNRSIQMIEFIRMLGDAPFVLLIPEEMGRKMPALALRAAAALDAVEIEPEPMHIPDAPPSPRAAAAERLLQEAERVCDELVRLDSTNTASSPTNLRRSSLCAANSLPMPRRLGHSVLAEVLARCHGADADAIKEDAVRNLLERVYPGSNGREVLEFSDFLVLLGDNTFCKLLQPSDWKNVFDSHMVVEKKDKHSVVQTILARTNSGLRDRGEIDVMLELLPLLRDKFEVLVDPDEDHLREDRLLDLLDFSIDAVQRLSRTMCRDSQKKTLKRELSLQVHRTVGRRMNLLKFYHFFKRTHTRLMKRDEAQKRVDEVQDDCLWRSEVCERAAQLFTKSYIVLMTAVSKQVFNEFGGRSEDSNFLGLEEIMRIMQKLLPLCTAAEIPHCTAQNVIQNYDLDHTGQITFREFVTMLGVPPYLKLLPPALQCMMPRLSRQTVATLPMPGMTGSETDVFVFLQSARELFNDLDSTGSGSLGCPELAMVAIRVATKVHQSLSDFELEERVEEILLDFDTDQSGEIGFPEFVQMLGQHPYWNLLPHGQGRKQTSVLVEKATNTAQLEAHQFEMSEIDAYMHLVGTLFTTLDHERKGRIGEKMARSMLHKLAFNHGSVLSANSLQQQLNTLVQCFDSTGDRSFGLIDLIRMCGYAPMIGWLPYEMRCRMPGLAELACFIHSAKELFKGLDTDDSGVLEWEEMQVLAKQSQTHRAMTQAEIDKVAKEAMATYDTDRDGSLGLREFATMLSDKPWRSMLPNWLQATSEALSEKAQNVISEFCTYLRPDAEEYLSTVRAIFVMLDRDDSKMLETSELGSLVRKLATEDGFSISPNEVDKQVGAALSQFGHNGSIGFDQWIPMLAVPPWKFLLPKSITVHLPSLAEEAWALKELQSLFTRLDDDSNGTLEPGEIMSLVSEQTNQQYSSVELADEVAKLLARFDHNGTGVLSQAQFALVLGQSPYLRVLPAKLQSRTPGIMSLCNRRLLENSRFDEKWTYLPVADDFIRFSFKLMADATAYFQDAGSWSFGTWQYPLVEEGVVDHDALANVVTKLNEKLYKDVSKADVEKQVDQLMIKFDRDKSSSLSPEQFMSALSQPPLSTLLPDQMRSEMPVIAELAIFLSVGVRIFSSLDEDNTGELGFEAMGKLYKRAEGVRIKNATSADSALQQLSSGHVWRAVNQLVKHFDKSEKSALNFQEFLEALSVSPYSYLMPGKIRQRMPGLAFLAGCELAKGLDSDVDMNNFTLEAKQKFEALDTDLSGEVELEELVQLVTEATNDSGIKYRHEALESISKEGLARFDNDQNGALCLTEFMHLLGHEPWLLVLSKGLQEQMPALAERSVMFAHQANVQNGTDALDPVARLCGFAKNMFEEYDESENGTLTKQQLHRLMRRACAEEPTDDQLVSFEMEVTTLDDKGAFKFDLLDFIRSLGQHPCRELLPKDLHAKMPGLAAHGIRFSRELANRRLNAKVLKFIDVAHELFAEAAVEQTSLGRTEIARFLQKVDSVLLPLQLEESAIQQAVHTSEKSIENRSVQVLSKFDRGWNGLLGFSEFLYVLSESPFSLLLPKEMQRRMPQLAELAAERIKMKGVRSDAGQVDAYLQISSRLFEEYLPAGFTELKWLELTEIVKDSMAEEGREFEMEYVVETVNLLMLRFDADDSGAIGLIEMMAMLGEPYMDQLLPTAIAAKMPALALLGVAAHEMNYATCKVGGAVKTFFDTVWALFDDIDTESTGFITASQLVALRDSQSNGAWSATATLQRTDSLLASLSCNPEEDAVGILHFVSAMSRVEFESLLPLAARSIDTGNLREALRVSGQLIEHKAVAEEAAAVEERQEAAAAITVETHPPPWRPSEPGKLDEDALFERAMGRSRPLPADSPLWNDPVKQIEAVKQVDPCGSPCGRVRWLDMPEWVRVTRLGRIGVQLRLSTVCKSLRASASKVNRAVFCVVPRDFSTITAALASTKSHGVVIVLPGEYLEDPIVITQPVELIGMPLGDNLIVIQSVTESTFSVECDSVRIETVTIIYSGTGTHGAIEVLHGSCTLEQCALKSASHKGAAVRIAHMGAIPTTLRICSIHGCQGMGVHCRKQGLVWLLGCVLSKISRAAVAVDGSGEISVLACLLKNNNAAGVIVQDGGSARLFSTEIHCSEQDGIVLKNQAQLVARGCSVNYCRGTGICVHSAEKVQMDDCSLSGNHSWAAEFIGSCSPQFRGCVLCNSDGGGLMVGRGVLGGSFIKCEMVNNGMSGAVIETRVVMRQCMFHGNRSSGVIIRASGKPTFIECEIDGNLGTGMEVRGAGSAPVVDCCTFSHGRHSGVLFTDNSGGRLSHCDIHRNRQSGVSIQDCSDPELISCNIHDGENAGVAVFGEGRGRLVSCTTMNNTPSGVSISARGNPTLTGCEIADAAVNGVFGIFVYDGGRGQVRGCRLVGAQSRALLIGENETVVDDNEYVEAHKWSSPIIEMRNSISPQQIDFRAERKGSLRD